MRLTLGPSRRTIHARLLYAHRGATKERPENTLQAFARAREIGVDAFETDAHLTADGHVVLSHDPTGERMARVPVPISSVPLEDVRRWDAGHGYVDERGARPYVGQGMRIPTLEEVLVEFSDVPLNVDAKLHDRRMAEALVAVVRRHRAEERVRIASFSGRTLRAVRRLGYEGETGLSPEEVALALALPETVSEMAAPSGHAAQLPLRSHGVALDRAARIAKLQRIGLRVDFWTIDDPAEARRLLYLGADGIMTDDPARIAPVFADLRRSEGARS